MSVTVVCLPLKKNDDVRAGIRRSGIFVSRLISSSDSPSESAHVPVLAHVERTAGPRPDFSENVGVAGVLIVARKAPRWDRDAAGMPFYQAWQPRRRYRRAPDRIHCDSLQEVLEGRRQLS